MKNSSKYTELVRKLYISALLLLLALGTSTASAQALKASVDRNNLSLDETLTLTLRYSGRTNTQLDFSALSTQFEIINQQQSNQFRSINGSVESFTEWSMILLPKSSGRLVVPSFKIGNDFSDAIEINVSKQAQPVNGTLGDVFIETLIEPQESYVQQQIRVRYRLYYSVAIQALERDDFTIDGAIVEAMPDVNYHRSVDGKPYNVAEFNYVVYPQESGTLEIPAYRWMAQLSRGGRSNMFGLNSGRSEVKRLRTEAKTINVKPKPSTFPQTATWIPATQVTIAESWNSSPQTFKVGEPVTRKIILTAQGLMSSQLPQLISDKNLEDKVKLYPEQPELSNDTDESGINGKRIESVAVVVSEGGELILPAVKIPWWDVNSNQLRYAELPEKKLTVAGDDNYEKNKRLAEEAIAKASNNNLTMAPGDNSKTKPNNTRNTPTYIWQIICALLILALGLALYLWLVTRHKLNTLLREVKSKKYQPSSQQSSKAAYNKLTRACRVNNHAEIRQAVIDWGRAEWPNKNIQSLADIASTVKHPNLENQLRALDATLYADAKNNNWNGALLLDALKQWEKDLKRVNDKGDDSLSRLYPTK